MVPLGPVVSQRSRASQAQAPTLRDLIGLLYVTAGVWIPCVFFGACALIARH